MIVHSLMKQKITEKDNPFCQEALIGYIQILRFTIPINIYSL